MTSRAWRPLCCTLVAAIIAVACRPEIAPTPKSPRLVLLYAPCSVSTSFLAPYDETIVFTPNLARFAQQAVTFTSHRTEAGSSGIAYASLFTGSQADRHGVVQHPTALRDDTYLIGEAFAEQGYETYFWNGQRMASMGLNYGQGVDSAFLGKLGLQGDDPRFVELLEGLRADPSRRAFVMTNFTLTHPPYNPEPVGDFLRSFPGEALPLDEHDRTRLYSLYYENRLAFSYNFEATARRFGIEPGAVPSLAAVVELAYKANIWRTDAAFGAVVEAVDRSGLRDDSLVVFTADHGQVMFREGELFKWTHSSSLAPEVFEVPLLIRAPGLQRDRYEAATRSIDVFPTMLGLSGLLVHRDRGIDGLDLSESVRGLAPAPDLAAYSHTSVIPESVSSKMHSPGGQEIWGNRMKIYPWPDIRLVEVAMRRQNLVFKLRNVDGVRFEVEAFDHSGDPEETVDLFDADNPRHLDAAKRLRRYKARLVASVSEGPPDLQRSQQAEELLRSLGYIR